MKLLGYELLHLDNLSVNLSEHLQVNKKSIFMGQF